MKVKYSKGFSQPELWNHSVALSGKSRLKSAFQYPQKYVPISTERSVDQSNGHGSNANAVGKPFDNRLNLSISANELIDLLDRVHYGGMVFTPELPADFRKALSG